MIELSDDRIRLPTAGVLRQEIGTSRIDSTLPLGLPALRFGWQEVGIT